jgi:protein-S-isoprenylcysteine O-methyltransferase Ste14
MRSSRVPPPAWMLLFAATMWALDRYCPIATLIAAPWNRLGWFLIAVAPLAPATAMIQFRRAHTTINPLDPAKVSALVTAGTYHWTRNPMYLGLSVLLLGWAVRLGTLSPFVLPPLFVLLMTQVQILPEEHALRERFGENYERYCRDVSRWLGRGRTL